MKRLFGTDGVRGVAGVELTSNLAMEIGKAAAYVLTKNKENVKVIIGNDGRESSDMLVAALKAGLYSLGVSVLDAGLIPTPGISYLVGYYNMDAGIMVTASHNSYEYNGIKIFDSNGYKLPDEVEDEIEKCIRENFNYPVNKIGRPLEERNTTKDYGDYLLECLKKYNPNINLSSLNIAIDTSNGAASKVSEYIYSKLGCNYHIINNKPNGTNINDNCGSMHPEVLKEYIIKNKLDGGVCYDGDADRSIFIDELGNIIDGDYIMSIIGLDLKKKEKLNNNTIVGTVMNNLGFINFCKENKINFIATKVGDRYVLEELKLGSFSLGGEQSGHIILKDYANTGDGELTSLILFSILASSSSTLSKLSNIMTKYPQVLINVKISNDKKSDYYMNDKIKEKISEIETILGSSGRVLVRPSGTEPLIRVMLEGKDLKVINKYAKTLADLIEEELN